VGHEFKKLVRLPGRKLQTSSYKSTKAYCASFRRNIIRH
jgi:hypothetical protein